MAESHEDLEMHEDHQGIRRSRRIAKEPPDAAGTQETDFSYCDNKELLKHSLFNHIMERQLYGFGEPKRISGKFLSNRLPTLLRPQEYYLGTVNKVFAAQFLNDKQVVLGTKCNKLLVLDLASKATTRIPSIQSSKQSLAADCPCGIHAIASNPSRTLLATGGKHTNDVAVYRLPTFDPVFLGEHGHRDWIFDIRWIDDEFCVTGSRDSKLAIWQIRTEEQDDNCDIADDDEEPVAPPIVSGWPHNLKRQAPPVTRALCTPSYLFGSPIDAKQCTSADKVRALAYNEQDMELGVLSLNSKIHIWDVAAFQQRSSRRLPHNRENVCIAYDPQRRVYAVGSQSHVSLIDARTLKVTLSVESKQRGSGVRSVGFNENIVTIGTGAGSLLFYDLMAGKYLDTLLSMGKGFLRRDDTWRDFFNGCEYANAVYAHCYDESNTRLFTAGGPLPAGLWGNYAAVWQ